eukprot:290473-Chlamydomonas_euryale.AAC.1
MEQADERARGERSAGNRGAAASVVRLVLSEELGCSGVASLAALAALPARVGLLEDAVRSQKAQLEAAATVAERHIALVEAVEGQVCGHGQLYACRLVQARAGNQCLKVKSRRCWQPDFQLDVWRSQKYAMACSSDPSLWRPICCTLRLPIHNSIYSLLHVDPCTIHAPPTPTCTSNHSDPHLRPLSYAPPATPVRPSAPAPSTLHPRSIQAPLPLLPPARVCAGRVAARQRARCGNRAAFGARRAS